MIPPDRAPPHFWFPETPERSGPGYLANPDAWIALRGQTRNWFTRGVRVELDHDPYTVLDRFFNRFSGGLIAGWLSYDLARFNHSLPDDRSSTPDPFLLLAHYPRGTGSSPDPGVSPPSLGTFRPTLSRSHYVNRVRRIRERIREGYVYQVNFSQRFTSSCSGSLRGLIPVVRSERVPPHAAGAFWGSFEAVSLSPERFLRVEGDRILTEPIKGTRPRSRDPGRDRALKDELRHSEKDRAEHVMIVDLERNDLNRICRPGSVGVSDLYRLLELPAVFHLVSTVEGTLETNVTPGHIFRETFPGGSVTGAPKSTALRVIRELEERRRGLYTGSLGFWDLDRDVADWNIAIRTLVKRGGEADWDAGGGVVYDSDPGAEYRESLDKVQSLRTLKTDVTSPSVTGG